MNKKLRLLVTKECHNSCELCCNNQYDLDKLPTVDNFYQYDEIIFTGGEPMLAYDKIIQILLTSHRNGTTKWYMYSSYFTNINKLINVLMLINGITLTIHNNEDVVNLKKLITEYKKFEFLSLNQDLRISYFPEHAELFKSEFKNFDLRNWKVKPMKWIENCPLPEGEDFKRI